MIAPRYIQKDPLRLFTQEREIQRHNEKINDIIKGRGRFSQEILKRNDEFNVLSRQSVKSTLSKFLQKEKFIEINRNNKALLDRLKAIGFSNKTKSSFFNTNGNMKPTLNATYKRQEMERITIENFNLAKRLFKSTPFTNQERKKKDIDNYLRVRKHMTKLNFFPDCNSFKINNEQELQESEPIIEKNITKISNSQVNSPPRIKNFKPLLKKINELDPQ